MTDEYENILPFDSEHVLAVPKVSAITGDLQEWIETVAFERLNFLLCSRRAGCPSGEVGCSKEGSSKEGRSNHDHGPCGPTGDNVSSDEAFVSAWSCKSCWRSWWGAYDRKSPNSILWNASWYPSNACSTTSGSTSKDQRHRECACCGCRRRPGYFIGIDLRDIHVGCDQSAKSGSNSACGSPSRRRSYGRIGFQLYWPFNVYQRRCQKRAYASRPCKQVFDLLPTDPAAALQAHEPHEGCPSKCRRAQPVGDQRDLLSREVWGVQEPKRGWLDALDLGPCGRLCLLWRFRGNQGALEQSALDGNWSLAFILSLMEDPPQQIFAERMSSMAATGRPFAPLIPPAWAATSLSYIKSWKSSPRRRASRRRPQGHPIRSQKIHPVHRVPKGRRSSRSAQRLETPPNRGTDFRWQRG